MQEWTTVDKSTWGEGPWTAEPDKVVWVDEATGLDCMIHRGPMGGQLCGYVGVPRSHPAYGKSYDEMSDLSVHGGLTFSAACEETDDPSVGICHVSQDGRDGDVWWLGFDCGHWLDVMPAMEAREALRGIPPIRSDVGDGMRTSYKTIAYVRSEVTSLARQLADNA